jgi:hypothetical protein
MNGYLLGLGPQKGKIVTPSKLYFPGNAHDKEEFGNCKKYLKYQNSIVNG